MKERNITLRHGQKVTERDGSTYVTGICRVLEEPYTTGPMPRNGLIDWLLGTPIQIAMPAVSVDDREFLISGTSPAGWGSMFKEDRIEDI